MARITPGRRYGGDDEVLREGARGVNDSPASSRGKIVALGAGLLGVGALVAFALAGSGGGREPARHARAPSVTPDPTPASRLSECPGGMVKIPAGRFRMGSPADVGQADEHPEHEVEVPTAFCMDRTEVTVAAYQACRNAGGCASDPNPRPDNFCTWGHRGFEQHPVNCVDWDQARAFCAWSGHAGGARRLPTEAEWEYAARGSAGRTYAWGNALEAGRANFCGTECVAAVNRLVHSNWSPFPNWTDAYDITAPVGSLPLGNTPEGLADMTGNVWEWVEDAYDANAYSHRPQGVNARRNCGCEWRELASRLSWRELVQQRPVVGARVEPRQEHAFVP